MRQDQHSITFSRGLKELLHAVAARVPISFEVLDRSLAVVLSDSTQRPFPFLDLPAEVREQLKDDVARPRTLVQQGHRIELYPVMAGNGRPWKLLLALRAEASNTAAVAEWGPVLRLALEADLTASDEVQRQAQLATHRAAALRFIQYVVTKTSDAEVLRSLLQAAAVWFDVESRIYVRGPSGDYVPHVCLPGAHVLPRHRIPRGLVEGATTPLRLASSADLESLGLPGPSAMFIPMPAHGADLLLVLLGHVPAELQLTFGAMAGVVGRMLAAEADTHDRASVRKLLGETLATASSADDALDRALRLLVRLAGAAGGTVVLQAGQSSRPIARIGNLPAAGVRRGDRRRHVPPPGGRLSYEVRAGADAVLRVELLGIDPAWTADPGHTLLLDDAMDLLRVWVNAPGTLRILAQCEEPRQVRTADFLTRLEEEIARARRYDLDLALVIVRSDARHEARQLADMLPKVRAELRDSDLLAPIGPDELAALLIQTGAPGSEAVVRRLHRRLSEDETVRGPAFVGHATFSNDCATAADLLTKARGPAGLPRFSEARGDRAMSVDREFSEERK